MKLYCIPLIYLITSLSSIPAIEGSATVTTETLVKKHGYPFESHQVQTSDGYLLGLYRIPYSGRVNTTSPRRVAFLMHGLLASSSDWVILGPDKSLAFILSDAGFDVWMGNARGSRFSRKHVTRNPQSKNFWNFSWHQIGMIDLPAMIDYARSHTGEDQIRYFGHSQGSTTFLVLNSLNLEFKNRIKSAHLLAPAAYSSHSKSPIAKLLALLLRQFNGLAQFFGSMEFLPHTKAVQDFGSVICKDGAPFQIFCTNLIFLICGFDHENFNTTMMPDIYATAPAGASINQLYHYLQVLNSGYFRQYDYGPSQNLVTYGNKEPPNYPLEKIDVPIFLYYSNNDFLADEVDVKRLISQLSKSTLRRAYKVPHPTWNHVSFMWGLHIREQLYDAVMEDLASIK